MTVKLVQVLRTSKLDISSSNLLRDAMLETDLDFWREPAPGKTADILVSRENMESVVNWLDAHGIGYSAMVEDVQRSDFHHYLLRWCLRLF